MENGIYSNRFCKVFSKLLEKSSVKCYQIHKYTRLDVGYLSRLKSGEKKNPSPETIVKIGLALVHKNNRIRLSDIEQLFRSVGRSLFTKKTCYWDGHE